MKWFLVASLCFSVFLYAAPPPLPGAGVIEREIEKEYESEPIEPGKEIPYLKIDIPEERLYLKEGVRVTVDKIEIRGNESINTLEILSWIEDRFGSDLCMKDIYEICEIIDEGYAREGYFLARAYPPPQTIENCVLIIEVMEGRLGSVTVEGNCFYSEPFIASYFTRLQCKALRYDSFMRALLLLNDFPDLQAGAVFTKGSKVGTADIIVKVKDDRPLHLYLNANNYGRKLTTNFRAGARLDAGNLATYGDKLSVAEVVGFPIEALYFTDVIYRIPVSRNGTFLEFSYLFSKFKIEELLSLHLKGRSDIATIKGVHSLTRSRVMSVDVFGYFDYKQIQNYALGQRISFDKLRVVTAGFLIDRFAERNGRDYLNIRVAAGIPNFLGGLSSVDSECSRIGGGGRFAMINADYDHIQHIWNDQYLYFHASGQYSPYKLTIPEQIYIGGADTVRGYPLACALGDMGYSMNFEYRIPPPILADKRVIFTKKKWKEILQIAGFIDLGGVHFNDGNSTFIWGSGLGFRLKGPWSLQLSLDVGWPLNHDNLSSGAFTYIKVTGQPF